MMSMQVAGRGDFDSEYLEADSEVVFHDYEDEHYLAPIHIPLPKPIELHKIDGYGLPAKFQMFQRDEMPKRLQRLQSRKIQNGQDERPITIEEIYEELDANQSNWRSEIKWIKKQWKRRLYGYWFFNNGKPTYIDGWHYVYLNSWPVGANTPGGLPYYTDRDRRWFHGVRFFYNHEKFYGIVYPKHRREGATFRSQCVGYCIATDGFERMATIQSKSGDDAKRVYEEKLKGPWKKMWFFWKPFNRGGTDPKQLLEFSTEGIVKRGRTFVNTGKDVLESKIIPFSSGDFAVDGQKVHFAHQDEIGKKDRDVFDVEERWNVTRECLSEDAGGTIIGLALLTSTVEEMEHGGGKEMFEICKNSFYQDSLTNETGMTNSGLAVLFNPAYDGMLKYVDEYGLSIIDDPVKPVLNIRGEVVDHGAKTFIKRRWEEYKKKENWKGLASFKRKYPTNFIMCFIKDGKDTGFNIEILNNRIEWYNRGGKHTLKRGYFRWVGGRRFGKVEFVPSPDKPKFLISHEPIHSFRNPIVFNTNKNSYVFERSGSYVSCSDPVKFAQAKKRVKSKGAGAVFRIRDFALDPEGTLPENMRSHKFCCTYNNEVLNVDDYAEDMLMMSWYYGAPHYPENNIAMVIDHFKRSKCEELLVYDVDQNGKRVPNPGYHVGSGVQTEIFSRWMNYIEVYGAYENHGDLLTECRDITGVDDMTNYDLFSAGGGCLLALDSGPVRRYIDPQDRTFSIDIPFDED